jgi:hypothetical protein
MPYRYFLSKFDVIVITASDTAGKSRKITVWCAVLETANVNSVRSSPRSKYKIQASTLEEARVATQVPFSQNTQCSAVEKELPLNHSEHPISDVLVCYMSSVKVLLNCC